MWQFSNYRICMKFESPKIEWKKRIEINPCQCSASHHRPCETFSTVLSLGFRRIRKKSASPQSKVNENSFRQNTHTKSFIIQSVKCRANFKSISLTGEQWWKARVASYCPNDKIELARRKKIVIHSVHVNCRHTKLNIMNTVRVRNFKIERKNWRKVNSGNERLNDCHTHISDEPHRPPRCDEVFAAWRPKKLLFLNVYLAHKISTMLKLCSIKNQNQFESNQIRPPHRRSHHQWPIQKHRVQHQRAYCHSTPATLPNYLRIHRISCKRRSAVRPQITA